jgi:hypothetical protein
MANRRNNINPFRSYKTQQDVWLFHNCLILPDPGVYQQEGEGAGEDQNILQKYVLQPHVRELQKRR